MGETLPVVYLARHGETAWTVTGQHTGRTNLPLTPNGERNARRLGLRLQGMSFVKVFTSPLQRAIRTCQLAGFGAVAEVDEDLVEWDYGRYEGMRRRRSWRTALAGNCFAMAAPTANRRKRWACARTTL